MLDLAMSRMLAQEIFAYHIVSYLVMILFLAGAAKRRGEALSPVAFIPFAQHLDFARKVELPDIAGLLLALGALSLATVDFFYGFVSMVRFADAFVVLPAYWYIWRRLTRIYNLQAWLFWLLFAPVVTANLAYLVLGLGWLLGKRPFEQDDRP